MKVFISWSGDLSHKVAQVLCDWLRLVIQATEPWISSEGVDKGELWFNKIYDQLESTAAGIVCLTRENMTAPWILFEAGALAKGLKRNRVYTLLVDISFADLTPPLSQFNGTKIECEDMLKLIKSINSGLADKALPEDVLEKAFSAHWSSLLANIETIKASHEPSLNKVSRALPEIMEELLETSRASHRAILEFQSNTSSEDNSWMHAKPTWQTTEALTKAFSDVISQDPFLKMDLREAIRSLPDKIARNPAQFLGSLSRVGRG